MVLTDAQALVGDKRVDTCSMSNSASMRLIASSATGEIAAL
jgi:hypothetical protein